MLRMKYKSAILLLLILTSIILTAGCTTTPGDVTTTTTTTANQTTGTGTVTTTQTGGTTSTTWMFTTVATTVPCARGTISCEVLAGYMPGAMNGWDVQQRTPSWDTYQGEVCDYTRGYKAYLNNPGGDPTLGVSLEFWDSNYDTEAMDKFDWIGKWPDFPTENGYEKAVTFNGYQGWEAAETGETLYVWLIIGNGIYLEFGLGTGGDAVTGSSDTELLYPFIYATNLDGLALLA